MVQVPVVFGCETRETGEIFNQEADGILGLGNSPISLVNQARCNSLGFHALLGHTLPMCELCSLTMQQKMPAAN